MSPEKAALVVWALWVVSWIAAARWTKPAIGRPPRWEQLRYRAMTALGAVLLLGSFGVLRRVLVHWDFGDGADWALVVVAAGGFAFAWWARLHLGALWSSSVTRKADHRVVDTGPYGIVRHPIYTGLIVAAFATALVNGAPAGLVGASLMTYGFWIKARLEERFLREQLGPDAYDSYRRRVPMLMPFGAGSG